MIVKYVVSWLTNQIPAIGDRVYPLVIPQLSDYPAIRVVNNALRDDRSKAAVSSIDEHLLRLDLFMYKYKDCSEAAKTIRGLLDRQHNEEVTADFIISGVEVTNIQDGGYEEEKRLYHKIIDLKIYTKPI